jgi:hypothetical protein
VAATTEAGVRGAMRWIVRTAAVNAGGAVYGTLMVGIMLAAEDALHEGYAATIEAATVVLVLYRLTSFYSHTLGVRLQRREPLDWNLV